MTARVPPKNVPTLTQVVQRPAARSAAGDTAALRDERLVQRVLQKLELDLDRRLRDAIATLVAEQTQDLGPRVRKELEATVRRAVADALAQERDRI